MIPLSIPLLSVDVREDLVRDKSFVHLPVLPVLLLARFGVPCLTMQQENGEVDDLEVGNGARRSGCGAPCCSHDEVAAVDDDQTVYE